MRSRVAPLTSLGIDEVRVERRPVIANEKACDLIQMRARDRSKPGISTFTAPPEQERHVHGAVDDDAAALRRIVERAPCLNNPPAVEIPVCEPLGSDEAERPRLLIARERMHSDRGEGVQEPEIVRRYARTTSVEP